MHALRSACHNGDITWLSGLVVFLLLLRVVLRKERKRSISEILETFFRIFKCALVIYLVTHFGMKFHGYTTNTALFCLPFSMFFFLFFFLSLTLHTPCYCFLIFAYQLRPLYIAATLPGCYPLGLTFGMFCPTTNHVSRLSHILDSSWKAPFPILTIVMRHKRLYVYLPLASRDIPDIPFSGEKRKRKEKQVDEWIASCETIFELFQHYGENWWRHDQILRGRRSIPLGGESFEIERRCRERTKFYQSWFAERSNRSRGGTVERLRRDAYRTTLVTAASRPFAPRQFDARARARARSRKWKHVKVGTKIRTYLNLSTCT